MKNNNEIKIAIAVAAIMLTICFVIVMSNKSTKSTQNEINNLKVYKHYDDGTTKEYRECSVSTNDLITINNEFKKIKVLDEDKKRPGSTINGTYKIVRGTDFIAFDGNNYLVYRGDTEATYLYQSDLYSLVAELC